MTKTIYEGKLGIEYIEDYIPYLVLELDRPTIDGATRVAIDALVSAVINKAPPSKFNGLLWGYDHQEEQLKNVRVRITVEQLKNVRVRITVEQLEGE